MPQESWQTPPAGGPARLLLAAILGLVSAMGPLCSALYLPALPQMAEALRSSTSEMQLTITACLLGLATGQILLGPLGDARGRKGPLLVSLALFSATSWLCSRATDAGSLILLRFLQGLAGSGGVVLARAMVCDLFRGTELTRFFALLMLIGGMTPILGPVLGGWLLAHGDWTLIFLFLTGFGMIQLLLAQFGLKESLPPERRTAGGLTASILRMCRLFRNGLFVRYMLVQGCTMGGFFAYVAAAPFVLQNLHGLTAQECALCFGGNAMGVMLATQLTGRLCGRFGDRALLWAGACLSLAGSAAIAVSAALDLPTPILLGALFLFVSSMGCLMTTSFSLAIASQDEGMGGAAGLLGVTAFVAGAAASPLMGLWGDRTAIPLAAAAMTGSLAVLTLCVITSGSRGGAKAGTHVRRDGGAR